MLCLIFSCTTNTSNDNRVLSNKPSGVDTLNLGDAITPIVSKRFEMNGMSYISFSEACGYTSPFIINLTKDSLEVALLRKKLK